MGSFIRVKKKGNTCCGACYLNKTQKCLFCAFVWLPIVAIVSLLLAVLINAASVQDRFVRQVLDPEPSFMNLTPEKLRQQAIRLGNGLKIKTISYNQTYQEPGSMAAIKKYITDSYPKIHSSDFIKRTVVNENSLLYRVEGTVETQNPYMLCAHFDVVPPGNEDEWQYDPFLGEIITENGTEYVYGRGAIDMKDTLFGMLEALEYLLETNQRPKRTFYMAFGHDEEVSGYLGAGYLKYKVKDMLAANREELDWILDEGMFVSKGIFPSTEDPMISIGVVEKGFAMLDLEVTGHQYHSSVPPKESVIGIMSNAVAKLEANKQPSRFGTGVESDMFKYAAPHAGFGFRLIASNLWLFSGLFSGFLSNDDVTDAIQRTTTAVTRLDAGFKDNVVPSVAKALVNHRIHPSDNIETVLEHDINVIDDERVKIKVREYRKPAPLSSYSNDHLPFQTVANSALDVYPDGHIVPSLMVANTDTLHYLNLTSSIYRFSPVLLFKEDTKRFHGLDERIPVKIYKKVYVKSWPF